MSSGSSAEELHGGALQAAISNAVVRTIADYTGRGPTRARTTIEHGWVFVTLEDTLTKGERRLVESGRADSVRNTRRQFQEAMRPELTRVVEEMTNQQVIAFMSDNHIAPDVAVEAFALAPA